MPKPYLIVTLGPTGSGKTNLIDEVIKYLDLEPNYKKFIVDDLVENNQNYKEKVLSIITNVDRQCKHERKYCKDENCDLCDTQYYYSNPDLDLLNQFNEAYFSVKKSKYCIPDVPLDCNDINDRLLAESFSNRENIILEATGTYIPEWIVSGKPFIKDTSNLSGISYISEGNPYQVIFAYSCVPFSQLVKRVTSRTITSIDKFTKDNSFPAPRLPDISYKNFQKKIKLTITVLIDIYKNCIEATVEEKCGNQRIDNLLIFDNSSENMIVVFDSKKDKITPTNFKHLLNDLNKLDKPVKGGNKKSRKELFNSKQKRKISKKYRMD